MIPRPNRKTGKDIRCQNCNNTFYVEKCRQHLAKYCSSKCYWDKLQYQIPWNKGLIGYMSGKKHWNWQGGINPNSNDKKERIKFLKYYQFKVFERDNYTCQLCGVRGVDLQVDHIQEWSKYIEQRFNIDNCRTLCAKCHYKITFGKDMPSTLKGWGHNLLGRVRIQK